MPRALAGSVIPAIPEITAHRGYSFAAPENTLAAVNLAWQVAADSVEVDVYLTADHQIALLHDGTTARTCQGINLKAIESTMDELRQLDAGKWRGDQWAGERIPTLDEVFGTVPEGRRVFVHIGGRGDVLPDFYRVIDASGLREDQVVAICFYDSVIREVKQARPALQAYWLCWPNRMSVDALVSVARESGADGLDAMVCDAFDETFARGVRKAGLGLYVWTVDTDDEAMRMAALGVDGITTNRPAEIRALLEGRR